MRYPVPRQVQSVRFSRDDARDETTQNHPTSTGKVIAKGSGNKGRITYRGRAGYRLAKPPSGPLHAFRLPFLYLVFGKRQGDGDLELRPDGRHPLTHLADAHL